MYSVRRSGRLISSAGASGLGGSGVRPEPQTRTSLTAVTAKASRQATPAERLEGELHKVPELARRAKPALARLLRRVNRRCSAFRRRSVGEACVDGPSLARSGGGFFGRAFACVHVSGLLMQPRLLAKMASAGGKSKQSSDLDRPLLARFISRCGSNDPVHLPFCCKLGKGEPECRFEPADLVRRLR